MHAIAPLADPGLWSRRHASRVAGHRYARERVVEADIGFGITPCDSATMASPERSNAKEAHAEDEDPE